MIILFQVMLLILIWVSANEISEKTDKGYRGSMVTMCIGSMIIFVLSTQL
jgi:hypothetical protein